MNCLRIKFILPNQYPLTFEEGKNLTLKIPEGEIEFKVNILKNDIYTSYTLKSNTLDQKVSPGSLKQIENALFLIFKTFDIGLLINPTLASGVITEHGKKELGENIESDFIGVKMVNCDTRHLVFTASASGVISGQNFIDALNDRIKHKTLIDEKLMRAIELYNSTNYLSRINSSGRFILLMSSIECLISQKENDPQIIDIVKEAQEKIKKLNLEKEIVDSVTGSLTFMKFESIKRSGKSLVADLFTGSTETFNDLNPVEFFSRAYDLRSKLVHEGKVETKALTIEKSQMQEFTRSCLSKYHDKYYS